MGAGFHGNIKNTKGASNKNITTSNKSKTMSNTAGSIENNAKEAAKYFPFKDGLFGSKNRKPKSKPREIFVSNPTSSASQFFNILKQGGKDKLFNTSHGIGIESNLPDGSRITYRPITSSKGSPAVEITISGSDYIKPKKYHFVMKGER